MSNSVYVEIFLSLPDLAVENKVEKVGFLFCRKKKDLHYKPV